MHIPLKLKRIPVARTLFVLIFISGVALKVSVVIVLYTSLNMISNKANEIDVRRESRTIRIATALGMKILAEGVENVNQKSLLQRAGSDYLQGYYFSQPLPLAGIVTSSLQTSSPGDGRPVP